MKWFEGGIPQAIQAAKNNKSVFIVFITSEDDASAQMESYLHREDVTRMCEASNCVAVKLVSNSNDCTFFSQIFPVVVIPSTFFIGDSGTPLEVIGECKTPEDFQQKVKAAIALQQSQSPSSPPESQSRVAEQQNSNATVAQSSPQKPMEVTEEEVVQELNRTENAEAGAVGGVNDGNGDEASPEKRIKTDDLSLEDRVERAKDLVREKQEQKAAKEAEEAKQKERERRQMGQGVQQLRQTQKEMEMLEAKKELRKDKEDDKLARQRVKEQIARDRAEKNARFSEAKAERDRAAEDNKKRKLMEQQAAAAAEQSRRSDISRIQFRLPDGSSITNQFPATDTFASVHQFITGQMGCAITLSTAFPRKTFTQADHGTTLQELGLAPTAVILVIPGNRSSPGVVSSNSGISLLGLLFSPIAFLWNMFASIFGLSSSSSSSSAPAPPPPPPSTSSQASATGGDRNPGSARQRDQGAIHRFRNAEDDEDDEDRATWNGNSTQQM